MKAIKEKWKSWLPLLLVVTCGLYGAWHPLSLLLLFNTKDIIFGDPVDAPLLVKGMESVADFSGSLKWWVGPWTMGADYAFYRPLTSLFFWLQYQSFGRDGILGFMAVHALSHFAVVLAAYFFLRELIGARVAALAASIFAMSLTLTPFVLPAAYWAMQHWKDQPDLWYSIPYLLSLWAFTCFLRRGGRRQLLLSVFAFVVGVLFKEATYTLPFVVLLLLWHEKKPITEWKYAVPFFGVAAAMVALRFWALGGMGFRFGTNGSWFERWLSYAVGGKPMTEITQGYLWPVTIACAVAAIVWFLSGKKRAGVLYLAVITGVFTGLNWSRSGDLTDPFFYALAGSARPWISAVYAFAFMFLVWRFAVNKKRGQIFGWAWVLLTYLPLMTAPITEHGLYLVSLGWSIWMAYAGLDLFSVLRDTIKSTLLSRAEPNRPTAPGLMTKQPATLTVDPAPHV